MQCCSTVVFFRRSQEKLSQVFVEARDHGPFEYNGHEMLGLPTIPAASSGWNVVRPRRSPTTQRRLLSTRQRSRGCTTAYRVLFFYRSGLVEAATHRATSKTRAAAISGASRTTQQLDLQEGESAFNCHSLNNFRGREAAATEKLLSCSLSATAP